MKNFSTVVGWLAVGTALASMAAACGAAPPSGPSLAAAPLQLLSAHSVAASAPIVASHDGRTLLVRGDRVWVRGGALCGPRFQVVRLGLPLRASSKGAPLAYPATLLGQARLLAPVVAGSQLQPAQLTASTQEIALGDYLVPLEPAQAGCAR